MEYPKTENLWARDPVTHVMAPENGYRSESFAQVNSWLVLEKIDGMNMRVLWDTHADSEAGLLRIFGRTSAAQIPGDLMATMQETFTHKTMSDAFDTAAEGLPWYELPKEVILFGEGYGAGIQKGGYYREDKGFILFDVWVDGHWLKWADVVDVAAKLNVSVVPVLGQGYTTRDVENLVAAQSSAHGLGYIPEGVIARTDPYLFNGRGSRVMFKHKVRDVKPYLESLCQV